MDQEQVQKPDTVKALARAAAYLCSAYDEFAAAGYEEWGEELRHLIDIVSEEIGWLEGVEGESRS